MVDRLLIDEIVALDSLRVQKVFQIFGHVLVLELFSPSMKKLYLVFDYNPKTRTLHVQRERPSGQKSRSALVNLLTKYATGQSLRFFKLDEEGGSLKAIFSCEGDEFTLLFDLDTGFSAGLFRASELLAKTSHDDPLFRAGFLVTQSKASGIDRNLAQAKKHYDALIAFHRDAIFSRKISQLKQDLAKKKALVKNVEQDLMRCQKTLELEKTAHLLKANLHLISRGMEEAIVTDYSVDPPTERVISLDKKLSPKDFLTKIFTKIKKAKRGVGIISTRLETIREEVVLLAEEIEVATKQGAGAISLDSLSPTGDIRPHQKRPEERLPYRSFTSSDQISIFVGKSAKDSDTLTLRFARGNEWWLHARDVPGAHVVVKSSLEALPPRTLIEAALLAQHFSKDRDNSRSAIQYTRVKYVQKKKGLPPGTVLITQEKTIDVELDQEQLKALLSR